MMQACAYRGGRVGRIAAVVVLSLTMASASLGWDDICAVSGNNIHFGPGVYLPRPYYSRQYLKQFVLRPEQVPLHLRLMPYSNYAAHRLGSATPGLATGFVDSAHFPYRYDINFQPPLAPAPETDDAMLRPQYVPVLSKSSLSSAHGRHSQ